MIAALLAVVAAMAPAPPAGRGIPGFPRLARPDAAGRRINAALAQLDARVAAAARACRMESPRHMASWDRTIATPMHGPDFVSYAVTDEVDCGGMYPFQTHSAIVYDLRSGAPVDWRALLPERLTGALGLTAGADGVKVVTLASRRLSVLYDAGYDARRTGDPAACGGGWEDDDGKPVEVPMLAWLDARRGGLMLQFDVNHATEACSQAVLVPLRVLRREGGSARLLVALSTAHARR